MKTYLLGSNSNPLLEIFSGMTVALALIPSSIAFSLVAHVSPLVGMCTTLFVCFITSLFGGRPGMISGVAGSMAVVITALVIEHGIDYLFMSILVAGIIQIIVGWLKLGKIIRLMSKPVIIGFVNGLAVVILLSQIETFRTTVNGEVVWMTGAKLYVTIGLVGATIFIIYLIAKINRYLPSSLIAIIVISGIVYFFKLPSDTVMSMIPSGDKDLGLPSFHIPNIDWNMSNIWVILSYGSILAVIGLSESLMTLSLIDDITKTHGKANKECIAQGIANVICSFFKGMGGCALVGQSILNLTSGSRCRLSGIVASVTILIIIVVAWEALKLVSVAALVGVMLLVVFKTFEWSSFKLVKQIPREDLLVIIAVMGVTICFNLASAVLIGIVISSLSFAWKTSRNIYAITKQAEKNGRQYKLYEIHGQLFFATSAAFKKIFTPVEDPCDIIIDFKHARIFDHSALDAIASISDDYRSYDKKIHLIHVSGECQKLLKRATNLVIVSSIDDPDYHILSNKLD